MQCYMQCTLLPNMAGLIALLLVDNATYISEFWEKIDSNTTLFYICIYFYIKKQMFDK